MAATTISAVVDRIDVLSYNVKGFRFRITEPAQMPFEAGQFVIVNVPKDLPPNAPAVVRERAAKTTGSVIKRAYSIASPPQEAGVIELCIQHVEGGIASTWFWLLKEGMTVSLSGPHGKFTLVGPKEREQIFLCTGTGVAPFRAMTKHLLHVNSLQPIWLFFGTRYEHGLLYEAEFRSLATMRRNFHYIPIVSRPKEWRGETGHVQQIFQKQVTNFANKEMYVCGWEEVVKSVVSDLQTFGVPREQIHYEEWA